MKEMAKFWNPLSERLSSCGQKGAHPRGAEPTAVHCPQAHDAVMLRSAPGGANAGGAATPRLRHPTCLQQMLRVVPGCLLRKKKRKRRGKTHLLVAHAAQHGLIIRLPFGQRHRRCTARKCTFSGNGCICGQPAATGRRLPRIRRVACAAAGPQAGGIQPGLCKGLLTIVLCAVRHLDCFITGGCTLHSRRTNTSQQTQQVRRRRQSPRPRPCRRHRQRRRRRQMGGPQAGRRAGRRDSMLRQFLAGTASPAGLQAGRGLAAVQQAHASAACHLAHHRCRLSSAVRDSVQARVAQSPADGYRQLHAHSGSPQINTANGCGVTPGGQGCGRADLPSPGRAAAGRAGTACAACARGPDALPAALCTSKHAFTCF